MPNIEIGSLMVQLNRKAIKNLHISVLPPDGRIRVAAPKAMSDVAIRMAVISKIPWIKQQQRDFAKQPRQSLREMVNGECHYLWGKRYRLDIVDGSNKHCVTLGRGRLHLHIAASTNVEKKLLALTKFYRDLLKKRIAMLLPAWETKIGVHANYLGVRVMKTKWGSCNTQERRIWLNLELVKKPPECLEFVLVHELVHLLERKHNDVFKAYMDTYLPDWRERRSLLNTMPLAFNNWVY